jgi:hypothetical protein
MSGFRFIPIIGCCTGDRCCLVRRKGLRPRSRTMDRDFPAPQAKDRGHAVIQAVDSAGIFGSLRARRSGRLLRDLAHLTSPGRASRGCPGSRGDAGAGIPRAESTESRDWAVGRWAWRPDNLGQRSRNRPARAAGRGIRNRSGNGAAFACDGFHSATSGADDGTRDCSG